METKDNQYEVPVVEILEIQTERFFNDSVTSGGENSGWE